MTNNEALQRAKRAIQKAWEKSEAFENGGMASGEIVDLLWATLDQEFKRKRSAA